MADGPQTGSNCRIYGLVAFCALLAFASSVVLAQPCTAALASRAGAPAAANAEKFRLIAQHCAVLAEPSRVHRAAQLDLYDRATPVSISMPLAQPPQPSSAPAALPADTAPPDRDAARVLSLAPALTAAARANDIDPLLLHAIAHIESRHNTQAVSPAGARGVMQMMPATAQRFGVSDPERTLFDAETNLRASAALVRTLRTRYGDDLRLVLAAYNAGEGAVEKAGGNVPLYPETQAYVRDVLAVYKRLGDSFTVSKSGALVARGV